MTDQTSDISSIITLIIQKMSLGFHALDSGEERRAVMLFMESGSLAVIISAHFGPDKTEEFLSLLNYMLSAGEAIARPTSGVMNA